MSPKRGRPGIIFILILLVAIIVLYFSWTSMMGSSSSSSTKDFYEHNSNGRSSKYPFNSHIDGKVHDSFQRNENKQTLKTNNINKEVKSIRNKDFGFEEKNNYNSKDSKISKAKNEVHDSENPNTDFDPATPYYHMIRGNPDSIGETKSMQRLVHLDLKGAAPKVSYFKSLFPVLNKLGATGLLVEYEDTFPFDGNLKGLAALNAYTKKDIKNIQELAKENGLTVMPLIQTFGHMEFVLKYKETAALRESAHTPQVIASTSNDSLAIISEMIKQVPLPCTFNYTFCS